MTPPLLPTLVVAVILAAASVFCPETRTAPAAPEAPAVRMSSMMAPAGEAPAEAAFVPAALAFPLQFPIAAAMPADGSIRQAALPQAALPQPVLPQAAAPAHRTAARVAVRNRPAPAKGAQQEPAAAMPVVARAEPAAPEAEEGVLPALALPFAPTLRIASQAASFVGVQSAAAGAKAVALGDAVADLVGGLR